MTMRQEQFCKGIYAGCCVVATARCAPCDRIAAGKSTVTKERDRKARHARRNGDGERPLGTQEGK